MLGPPSTLAEIFRHTCLQSGLQNVQNWLFSHFPVQIGLFRGGRGGPRNFFCIGILLFLLLMSPCKISNSYDIPLLGFSNGSKKKRKEKFPLVPMGVLAPGSAHARPSARPPIDTSGNFPPPVSAEWPSAFKTVKIGLFWGVGGAPEIFFLLEPNIFVS